MAQKTQEYKNLIQNITHLLRKIGKLILNSFQNIAQQFNQKNGGITRNTS